MEKRKKMIYLCNTVSKTMFRDPRVKEINEPIKVLDRTINDNNKGRKLLPSITSIWNI